MRRNEKSFDILNACELTRSEKLLFFFHSVMKIMVDLEGYMMATYFEEDALFGANDSTQNYLRVYVLGIILALFCLKFFFDAINPIWEELKIKSFSLILIGKG